MKICIVLEGFRRYTPIRDLCRREGIKSSTYYACLKDFMEAGRERLYHVLTKERNGLDDRHERAIQIAIGLLKVWGEAFDAEKVVKVIIMIFKEYTMNYRYADIEV